MSKEEQGLGRVPSAPGSHPSGHAAYGVDGASRFDPSRDERFLVPWTPPEAAWSGIPRDMIMWLRFGPGSATPRALFQHLERMGRDVPQWLRDEPEMRMLDHVPSKGTCAVIIYRAMLEACRRDGLSRMVAEDEALGLYDEPASAIEAASADETRSGSAEGKSAAPKGGDAHV